MRHNTVKERTMTRPKEFFSSYSSEFNYTPHTDDGDFLSQKYENPVRDDGIKLQGRPERHHDVIFQNQTVTLEDGTYYNVVTTEIPEKHRKAGSDIANIETTAWTTKPDGVNKIRMHALAKHAIPSVFVSVQQNIDRRGRIARSAHNEIQIHQAMAELYGYDPQHAITNGISRGGMTGLVVASIAKKHNLHVAYTDSIVPVRPDGINPMSDLKHIVKSLPHEGRAIASLRDVPFADLAQYPNSLDLSAKGIWQQIKEVPTLLSGEVGRQIDKYMPSETFGYVTAYDGDIFSQGSRWRERFNGEDYPNMIVDTSQEGAHMSCILNENRSSWLGRMDTISEILHENTANRYLGGTALRAMAAERNPVFLHSQEQGGQLRSFRLRQAL